MKKKVIAIYKILFYQYKLFLYYINQYNNITNLTLIYNYYSFHFVELFLLKILRKRNRYYTIINKKVSNLYRQGYNSYINIQISPFTNYYVIKLIYKN